MIWRWSVEWELSWKKLCGSHVQMQDKKIQKMKKQKKGIEMFKWGM